eukprot:5128857-Alexandrium_andersonii.AAC.1
MELLTTRRFEAIMLITTPQGELFLRAGSGGLMGDSNEPELFMANHYQALEEYTYSTFGTATRSALVTCPIFEQRHNAGIGVFVDDLLRLIILRAEDDL